jgi:hypothetical protein
MVNPDPAAAVELERRYRRLLLAYPRWYRSVRGLEMLTTLLDAAAPGQRRPTWRDLVLRGLRCRLGLPGRAAVMGLLGLTAVLVAAALPPATRTAAYRLALANSAQPPCR